MFLRNLTRSFGFYGVKMFVQKSVSTTASVHSTGIASSLAKLRKSTGYTMVNCKKALELHPDDLAMAEEWLHKEAKKQGWSKIANLQHRTATQGLVGVYIKNSVAAMVEVNCETDFVAKNSEFQIFVEKVLSSCLNHTLYQTVNEDCRKILLDGNSINSLIHDETAVENLVASAVGKFGEKIAIQRAVCFKTGKNILLGSFCHPLTKCPTLADGSLGKYGGIIAYRSTQMEEPVDYESLPELGHQLSQHIVGMNPQLIGEFSDKEEAVVIEQEENDVSEELTLMSEHMEKDNEDSISDSDSDEEKDDPKEKLRDSNETRLLHQQFLIEPSMKVGQFLKNNSIEVLDFQRFECGETYSV